jgi:hypothetical protein
MQLLEPLCSPVRVPVGDQIEVYIVLEDRFGAGEDQRELAHGVDSLPLNLSGISSEP